MAKSKKLKFPTNFDFESTNQRYDFTKICKDMQKSPAWKSLNLRQRGLYLELKFKFTANPKTLSTNADNISFTTTEAKEVYGDLRTFRGDVDALINAGFIKQIISGVPTMSANIYGFSDKWKDYGTEKFFIPERDKRYTRKNRTKITE